MYLTHGMTNTPEYMAWRNILARCCNPKTPNFAEYGGRGIRVCDAWLNSFDTFYAYIGTRPSAKHSIDRFPNKDGNYEPGNVRWATRLEQQQNLRKNVNITKGGDTLCAGEWSRRLGIPRSTILQRVKSGMTAEEILTPTQKRPREMRGVYWHKRLGRWQAALIRNRKQIHLGTYDSAKDAMEAIRIREQAA